MLPDDVKAWSRTPFITRTLIHCYGPTETTVYVANTEVPLAIENTAWEKTIPIGKAVAGRRIDVLDGEGMPVADGSAGEICIGGNGLARGYLNRAAQTAEVFRPDPFATIAGARLYRTGDLGRRLADGSIEFLGRLDHQVKIRGYRVEPREVERALRDVPTVSDAIVVGRAGRGTDQQLVAYLVCSAPRPEIKALQQFLAGRLPAYMIPAQYVFL